MKIVIGALDPVTKRSAQGLEDKMNKHIISERSNLAQKEYKI